jgi:TRAP-type mannitol/chloroaromatic compound transport system permease large subunit
MPIFEGIAALLTLNELAVIAIFITFIYMLFRGIPVAMALVGVALIYILIAELFLNPHKSLIKEVFEYKTASLEYRKLSALSGRLFGSIVQNPVLVALPMFIFMGLMLDQSGVAQRMMHAMQKLFGGLKGGLSLTVLLIGIILAASTGVIGASVTLLGVMALPAMMKQDYSKPIASLPSECRIYCVVKYSTSGLCLWHEATDTTWSEYSGGAPIQGVQPRNACASRRH